jgi:hypothetical protein
MAQKHLSELLLAAPEIQPRVPRRTVSPQHAQAFQTPAWADATPQPTIAVASARFSLQIMHVTVFTAERRLAPAASSETASSSHEFLFLVSSSKSLVPKDHTEVSAVTRAVKRLSWSLQPGVGFLRDPLPGLPSAFLAVCFPLEAEKVGLTTFYENNRVG